MDNYSKPTGEWYTVDNVDQIDSPALLVYAARAKENIRLLKSIVKDVNRLRPHVKTNKMAEVCAMMMAEGIRKFKCATIAEAEMLAGINAPDILLSYQPVGPKIMRLVSLIKAYPAVQFSCLVDNAESAAGIAAAAKANNIVIPVFIDLNVGMNRTGIKPSDALALVDSINTLTNIELVGLHGYDGHIRDTDINSRSQKSNAIFTEVETLHNAIQSKYQLALKIVMGGTPTFPIHAQRMNVECSPGTFVFSDWGYKHLLPDEPFEYAALVISRVISIVDEHTICADLGHKSVAAENPLPRVHFLNAPDAKPVGQSEEHLVLQVEDAYQYKTGDVLYGVPVHICPTVALYDRASIIEGRQKVAEWEVVARKRSINF
ncbi:MAG TPA: D-TA family PLP-dependent enzyme [Agriterribacter sp.]|nr:D-TA family PLP-dependent enzyme [Agriterribacter sp.]